MSSSIDLAAMTSNAVVPAWTWAIPLIVGLIALAGVGATALISYLNMRRQIRSSHILKIAEMRQSWINDLRSGMASFQSYGGTPDLPHQTQREFYELGTKIELFMNPLDPDFEALQRCLYDYLSAETVDEKYKINARYVEICQRILKREWEVLKQEIKRAS